MALQAKVSHADFAAFGMVRTKEHFLKREKNYTQGPVYVTSSLGRELTDLGLYSEILKRIQDVNEYGGGASIFQIRQAVLDAVDAGADNGDQTLVGLRVDLRERANAWSDVEDHEARSSFFDTYCEATFYLSSSNRIEIEGIPRSASSTPDFKTLGEQVIYFEVKTLDMADPSAAYARQMAAGLDGNIEALDVARSRGVGFSTQVIRPHGDAQTWPEVIEQTMRKLSSHIKKPQYANGPTFLVANLARLSVCVDAEQLSPTYLVQAEDVFDGNPFEVTGQLWAIANHELDEAFHWVGLDGRRESKPIKRAGLLRDYPFIQGIIFTNEPWSDFDRFADWRDSYRFLGVWNEDCTTPSDEPTREAAKELLNTLCGRVVSTR